MAGSFPETCDTRVHIINNSRAKTAQSIIYTSSMCTEPFSNWLANSVNGYGISHRVKLPTIAQHVFQNGNKRLKETTQTINTRCQKQPKKLVPPENLSNSTLKITASISNTPKALRHQPETCSNFYCNFYGDTTDKIIEKSTRKKSPV